MGIDEIGKSPMMSPTRTFQVGTRKDILDRLNIYRESLILDRTLAILLCVLSPILLTQERILTCR